MSAPFEPPQQFDYDSYDSDEIEVLDGSPPSESEGVIAEVIGSPQSLQSGSDSGSEDTSLEGVNVEDAEPFQDSEEYPEETSERAPWHTFHEATEAETDVVGGYGLRHRNAALISAFVATPTPELIEPQTFEQAMASPQARNWQLAMREQMKALSEMTTWALVPPPPTAKVLSGKWVYKLKLDADGLPVRWKARWVVRGFEQSQNDYGDTYAAVCGSPTFRSLMSIAVARRMAVHQMDFITAFLNGLIEKGLRIYVQQPTGFESGDLVCLLQKALYGLKQAPNLWYQRFADFVQQHLGFRCSPIDQCVFISSELTMILYVDDVLIASTDLIAIERCKRRLATEFRMKDLGPVHYYLGIRVIREPTTGHTYLLQDAYIRSILTEYGMVDCRPVATPMAKSIETDCDIANSTEMADPRPYRRLVGKLMFLPSQTRPDLAYSISWLGRHSHRPFECHMTAAKRVLRYRGVVKPTSSGRSIEPSS